MGRKGMPSVRFNVASISFAINERTGETQVTALTIRLKKQSAIFRLLRFDLAHALTSIGIAISPREPEPGGARGHAVLRRTE